MVAYTCSDKTSMLAQRDEGEGETWPSGWHRHCPTNCKSHVTETTSSLQQLWMDDTPVSRMHQQDLPIHKQIWRKRLKNQSQNRNASIRHTLLRVHFYDTARKSNTLIAPIQEISHPRLFTASITLSISLHDHNTLHGIGFGDGIK
jgi:hypothetical protein